MATNRINLNTSQYVRINVDSGQLIVEALAGDIHVVLSEYQPAVRNSAFHKLTDRQRLVIPELDPDINVWALAKNTGSQAVVTEFNRVRNQTYFSAFSENVSISSDTPVLVVRNPTTFGGETNTRDIELARITVTVDKKSSFKFWTTIDATAIVGATFKPVNSGSHMECDSPDVDVTAVRATSVDTAKLNLVTLFPVPALGREIIDNPNPDKIDFRIEPGTYLVITGSASTGTADCVMEWGEII